MYQIINGTPGTRNCYFVSKEKANQVCSQIKSLGSAFNDAKVVKVKFVAPW